jgi:hypothetical protein
VPGKEADTTTTALCMGLSAAFRCERSVGPVEQNDRRDIDGRKMGGRGISGRGIDGKESKENAPHIGTRMPMLKVSSIEELRRRTGVQKTDSRLSHNHFDVHHFDCPPFQTDRVFREFCVAKQPCISILSFFLKPGRAWRLAVFARWR